MLMSEERLPESLDAHLDAILEESNFTPKTLPSQEILEAVANSKAYREGMPDAWERVKWYEHVMLKSFFGIFRFWKWGENLKTYWLSHRANHANFVSKTITTEIDGEAVPYTLTEDKGVCSSCAEFFNVENASPVSATWVCVRSGVRLKRAPSATTAKLVGAAAAPVCVLRCAGTHTARDLSAAAATT